MLPVIFGFTRYETDPTPGQVIQWWTITDWDLGPPPEPPYTPTPARTLLVRRQRRTITVAAED